MHIACCGVSPSTRMALSARAPRADSENVVTSQLDQLAMKNGHGESVEAYGQHMVKDHDRGCEAESIATKENLT